MGMRLFFIMKEKGMIACSSHPCCALQIAGMVLLLYGVNILEKPDRRYHGH
jgi:hypothetical protein